MILRYTGYTISIILAISSVVLFLLGLYIGAKDVYLTKGNLTEKSFRVGKLYTFYSMLSLFSSGFILYTIEMGFSWGNLFALIILAVVISVFMWMGYLIERMTLKRLYKRRSIKSTLLDNPVVNIFKNPHARQNTEIKKEK
jgi:hypothetical protein